MMHDTNEFYLDVNRVENISDEKFSFADTLIKSLNSFNRLSNKSIYVIDLSNENFLYVSENPLFLCGRHPDEIKKMGYRYYLEMVPEDERNMLLEFNRKGIHFFYRLDIEKRLKCSVSFDFHICYGENKILVNQKMTPLLLADNGKLWLVSCLVSLSHRQQIGTLEMHFEGSSEYWSYTHAKGKWSHFPAIEPKMKS